MTSIEKSTMKTTTVAIVIVTVVSSLVTGLTTYFSSVHGTKEGFNQLRYEMNLKFKDLDKEDEMIRRDLVDLEKKQDRLESAFSFRTASVKSR